MEAFVYCWTDLKYNKLYIGWHKGSPYDGYICSSKIMKEEYSKRPLDFSRKIIATGSVSDMVSFEATLLLSADAKNNDKFYNMHNGNGKFKHAEKHTIETKEKMSIAHSKRTKYAKGWKFTQDQKDKHLKGLTNYWDNVSKEQKRKHCYTESHAISLANRNKQKLECPHCKKIGHFAAMKRWHFDNCRELINVSS